MKRFYQARLQVAPSRVPDQPLLDTIEAKDREIRRLKDRVLELENTVSVLELLGSSRSVLEEQQSDAVGPSHDKTRMAGIECGQRVMRHLDEETSATIDMNIKQEPDDRNITQTRVCGIFSGPILKPPEHRACIDTNFKQEKDDNNSFTDVNLKPSSGDLRVPIRKMFAANCKEDLVGNISSKTFVSRPAAENTNVYNAGSVESIVKWRCEICGAMFCHETDFMQHGQRHDIAKQNCQANTVSCKLPKEQSNTIDNATCQVERPEIYSGLEQHTWDMCGTSLTCQSDLTRQSTTHSAAKLYQCGLCEKSFTAPSKLSRHLRTHTGEKTAKCELCEKTYVDKSGLTYHMRTHTGEKPYQCDICQKSLSSSCNLSRHLREHTGEKTYKCKVCEKTFDHKGSLTVHIRTHTGEKLHHCDICGKSFTTYWKMNRHMSIHTGEKPYKCEVCEKTYVDKTGLTYHMRKHTGEKPYQCDICQKSFTSRSDLSRHLRVHTGEKPYRQ